MSKHQILHKEPANDDDADIVKTTHERVRYDSFSETFIVDLGRSCWAEVYGKNRLARAVDIAEKCFLVNEKLTARKGK